MKKMTFLTASVVVLLLLNAITLFILFGMRAKDNDRAPRDPGKGPAEFIIRELKLDEQQQKQFAQLRDQHRQAIASEEREDHRLHDLYFNLLKSDSPDRNKADSIATLIGQQKRRLAAATFDHFQQLRAICRDDQKKLFDNVIDEIAAMVGGHAPEGGPPPERN